MPLPAALMAAGPIAGLMGKIFGGAAKGSADQRMGENQQALLQAQLANRDTLDRASLTSANQNTRAGMQNADNQFRAGLDMERKRFTQTEPNMQARQALVGNLMERIQPLALSGLSDRVSASMPKMNSILDSLGPEAREAGSLLAKRGLSGLQVGPSQFADIPPVMLPEVLKLPPAQIAAMQKSGLLEKIMGGLGIAGSVVGALGDLESVDGGDTPSHTMSNRMPSPYSGQDQYGNASNFQLPRPGLNPNLEATYFGYGGG